MLRKAVYVVRVVTEMGGSRLDPTLFVWRKRGRIIGIMVTHIDDFCFGENSIKTSWEG